MYRTPCLVLLTLAAVFAFDLDTVQFRAQLLNGDIVVVNETTRFQRKYPNVTLNGMMLKTKLVKGQINYQLGKRIPGDQLVAEKADKQSFPAPEDIQIVLRYPTKGEGATVSHVNIVVDQSSSVGDGYVIEGGISQKFIGILVEANNTMHFTFSASIYGYY
uniref:Venom polypeptide n=1 Tax=Dolopus genitalis TaxID=2488630 RepID=A0A3G5BID4_DOLGE|nr:venom polypeptide [Dolopus genitalis]